MVLMLTYGKWRNVVKRFSNKVPRWRKFPNKRNGEIAYLKQQSDGYEISLKTFFKLGLRKYRIGNYLLRFSFLKRIFLRFRLIPLDQTSLSRPVLAQNCMVIRKI